MKYTEKSAMVGAGLFGLIVCLYNWAFGGGEWFLFNAILFSLNILYAITR